MKKAILTVCVLITSLGINAQVSLPYFMDFESTTFPPANCETFPIGSPVNWIRDTSVSGYGASTACISFDNYNNTSGYYGIRLPSMNFSQITLPYIRFDVAYAERILGVSDNFGLWWSNNGSTNWQNLQNWTANTLTTSPYTANVFVPTPADWRTTLFPLTYLVHRPYVRLAIEDDCSNGNFLYIDNIIIFDSASTTGMSNYDFENHLFVYPSPFNDELNVRNNSRLTQSIQFTLYNILGEQVFTTTLFPKNNLLDLGAISNGVYLYKLSTADNIIKTGKVIKNN